MVIWLFWYFVIVGFVYTHELRNYQNVNLRILLFYIFVFLSITFTNHRSSELMTNVFSFIFQQILIFIAYQNKN